MVDRMSPAVTAPSLSNVLSNAANDRADLSKIDPRDFRDWDRWSRFMVRCFHSGVAWEDFIAWRVGDPGVRRG